MAYFIIIISSFVAIVGAQALHVVWPKLSVSCHRFGCFPHLSRALVLSMTCLPHAFSPLASQRASPSLNDATSGVAKVLRDLKEVLGEPESRSTNLADNLTHVGRRGNNSSPRGWVGGGGWVWEKRICQSRPALSPRESRELTNIILLIFLSP